MGLFDLFKKKETNYLGEDLSKLTKDGEIPWGWHSVNRGFTKPIENEYCKLCEAAYNAKSKGVKEEYSALKSLADYCEHVRRLCAQKGECFVEWAAISVNNPVSMGETIKRLSYLEENMEELLKQETMLKTLKRDLVSIISKEPGVVQSDLYKRFDASIKNHVSNELYQMEIQNLIIREKSGRSYKLYIK